MQFAFLRESSSYKALLPATRTTFLGQVESSRSEAFAAGGLTKEYAVADRRLRVHYSDERVFERMSKAISHLDSGHGLPVDLTVYAWDATSARMPDVPWNLADVSYRGDVQLHGLNIDGLQVAHRLGEKIFTMLDRAARTAFVWTQDIEVVPNWAMGAPFRTLFHLWLTDEGLQMVHGAVVGEAGLGVLLSARGGSGKSTTSITCLRAGMRYVGDDYVAMAFDGSQAVAHSLYNTGKLHRHVAQTLPEFVAKSVDASETNDDKLIYYINDGEYAPLLATKLPVSAVMVPMITGRSETVVRPLSGAIALAALAPTTLTQLPYCDERSLASLKRLVETVPCFALELGRCPVGVVQAIKGHLASGR